MSQNYFDYFVNRIGEQAVSFQNVVGDNRVTNEEINNWEES